MSRTLTIALGVVLWTAFAIDALRHVAEGEWFIPALAIVVVTALTIAYHARRRVVRAS